METIPQEIKDAWVEVYFSGDYADPHLAFADKLNINRSDAKRLCYVTMYSSKFLRAIMDDNKETLDELNALKKDL